MNHTAACLVAVAAASGMALGDTVSSTDTKVAELTELVGELQQEIAELRASNGDDWLTEQRAEEVRALVYDVLSDADTRASLLQSGMTSGYDGGFVVGSADGNFKLKMNGQIQVRYVWNNQDDGSDLMPNTDDAYRSGFEVRRAKLKFKGHIVDPTWKYNIVGAFARDSGHFVLEDAEIIKAYDGGWQIRVGQFKGPFMREELVSSSRQMTVDRSLVNERFNQDRSQGIEFSQRGDQFGWAAMYGDGVNTDNTPWEAYDTEWAFMARAEFLAAGTWKQFKSLSGFQGGEFGMLIGGAVLYQSQEYGGAPPLPGGVNNEIEDLRVTADVNFQWDGANIFAAFVYQDLDSDAPMGDSSPWGFVVQGGFFLNEKWELFARYEYGDDDLPSAISSDDDLSVVTAGFNYYFSKHQMKWTSDIGIGLNEVGGFWDKTSVGWRDDLSNEDGQIVIRTQLQLLF